MSGRGRVCIQRGRGICLQVGLHPGGSAYRECLHLGALPIGGVCLRGGGGLTRTLPSGTRKAGDTHPTRMFSFWKLFWITQIHLFWNSCDVCPRFQSQGGSLVCILCRLRLRFTSDAKTASTAAEPFFLIYLLFQAFALFHDLYHKVPTPCRTIWVPPAGDLERSFLNVVAGWLLLLYILLVIKWYLSNAYGYVDIYLLPAKVSIKF